MMSRSAIWATLMLVATVPLAGQEPGGTAPAVVAAVLMHASKLSDERPLHVDTLRSEVNTEALKAGARRAGATIGSAADVLEADENGKWVRWATGSPGGAVIEIHEIVPQTGGAVRLHYLIYIFMEDVGRTEGYTIELDLKQAQGQWAIQNVRVIAET